MLGTDPAGPTDFFSLGQSGNQNGGDWRKAFAGASTYKDNFAAGTAFLELKRSDPKGIQLTRLGEHEMQAIVAQGLSGWVWTAPGVDQDYNFRADGDASRDAALINGFLKIVDRLTINGDKDPDYRLRVNGDTILNGLLKVISVLNLDSVLASKPIFTDANKNLIAQNIDLFFGNYFANFLPISLGGTQATTAAGARTNLDVYSKAEVDALLAGKSNVGHTHGISLYTGTAGDPPHEHLVQGSTGA